MSINRWVTKEDMTIYNGILCSHKKGWDCATCDNMDGPGGYYAKGNMSDWERQISYYFTHTLNLRPKQTNEYTNKKQNQTYNINTETDGCQRGGK